MRTNKITIKITGYNPSNLNDISGQPKCEKSLNIDLQRSLTRICRTAKKIGDIETINHTMLSWLKDANIPYEIIS